MLNTKQGLANLMVIGPGFPSPVTHVPCALFAAPTGETTAAVPQAKISVISPDATPSRQSSVEIIPSSTL